MMFPPLTNLVHQPPAKEKNVAAPMPTAENQKLSRHPSAYRPRKIKIPAAIASTCITVPSPEKLRLSIGMSAVRISQAASNSIPRFLVNVIPPSRKSRRVPRYGLTICSRPSSFLNLSELAVPFASNIT